MSTVSSDVSISASSREKFKSVDVSLRQNPLEGWDAKSSYGSSVWAIEWLFMTERDSVVQAGLAYNVWDIRCLRMVPRNVLEIDCFESRSGFIMYVSGYNYAMSTLCCTIFHPLKSNLLRTMYRMPHFPSSMGDLSFELFGILWCGRPHSGVRRRRGD